MTTTPCTKDPEAWFATDHHATKLARLACGDCPIIAKCLQLAMDAEKGASRSHRFGVYGGLTPEERAVADGRPARTTTRKVAACGTPSGYNAHRRKGEVTCQACRDAQAAAWRRNYRPKGAAA